MVRVVVREEARRPEIAGEESGVEGGVISLLSVCGVGLEGEGGLVDAGVRVVDAILDTVLFEMLRGFWMPQAEDDRAVQMMWCSSCEKGTHCEVYIQGDSEMGRSQGGR